MKDFYICDCARQENKIITSTFVVAAKQIKPKKTGEPYLSLTLGDRTGQLEAKMWDNVEEVLEAFEQDDFIKVKGLINKYKDRFQLTIHKLRKLGESEIDFSDYLPKTTKDVDELWQTLSDFVASFQNPAPEVAGAGVHGRSGDRRTPTGTRPPPRRCITPSSAACSITWCRCSAPAICSAATIRRSIAICC